MASDTPTEVAIRGISMKEPPVQVAKRGISMNVPEFPTAALSVPSAAPAKLAAPAKPVAPVPPASGRTAAGAQRKSSPPHRRGAFSAVLAEPFATGNRQEPD
jgi:hypothetical protein